MKARVTVGPVDVRTEGITLGLRELRALMRLATDMALAVIEEAAKDDTPEANPIGFTALMERAEDTMADTIDGDDE